MDLKLAGKHALVTGGSRGIGFATASILSNEGARVTIASRSRIHLDEASKQLPLVNTIELDLLDVIALKNRTSTLVKDDGVDILVVNSGGPPSGLLADLTWDQWQGGFQLLLGALFQLVEVCAPHMKSRRWGRILNITSTSAVQIIPHLPMSGTLRAGLSAWVKHAAKELSPDGIMVNNLLPGPTRTDRLSELRKKSPESIQAMESASAVRRIAEAAEIASVAVFLCSGVNTYLTGTDVLVDGGFTTSV